VTQRRRRCNNVMKGRHCGYDDQGLIVSTLMTVGIGRACEDDVSSCSGMVRDTMKDETCDAICKNEMPYDVETIITALMGGVWKDKADVMAGRYRWHQ